MRKVRSAIFRLMIQSLLYGLVFAFIIPHIHGAFYHSLGKPYMAGIMGVLMAGLQKTAWGLLQLLVKITTGARMNVTTTDSLLWLLVLSCAIMPALQLLILAKFFPAILGFATLWATIKTSLHFSVILFLTRERGEQ